jgi:hypothetical protein
MSKKDRKFKEQQEDFVNFKEEFGKQYQQKKLTQKQAKERRRMLREMKEDQEYWN